MNKQQYQTGKLEQLIPYVISLSQLSSLFPLYSIKIAEIAILSLHKN